MISEPREIIIGDISEIFCQVMVNPANAKGDMGWLMSRIFFCRGVSESINFHTKGRMEKEVKRLIEKEGNINLGSVLITDSLGLPCEKVAHVVTVPEANKKSSKETLKLALENLTKMLSNLPYTDIAIPLIGCGVGGLDCIETFREMRGTLAESSTINYRVVVFDREVKETLMQAFKRYD